MQSNHWWSLINLTSKVNFCWVDNALHASFMKVGERNSFSWQRFRTNANFVSRFSSRIWKTSIFEIALLEAALDSDDSTRASRDLERFSFLFCKQKFFTGFLLWNLRKFPNHVRNRQMGNKTVCFDLEALRKQVVTSLPKYRSAVAGQNIPDRSPVLSIPFYC